MHGIASVFQSISIGNKVQDLNQSIIHVGLWKIPKYWNLSMSTFDLLQTDENVKDHIDWR